MKQTVRGWWSKFHASFRGSETILWARLQFVFFCFYTAAQQVDISAFISDHRLLQGYILMNGFVGELLRRRREDWQRGQQS
jgi:hypothetical protein